MHNGTGMHNLVGKAGCPQKKTNVTFFKFIYNYFYFYFYSGHWNCQSLLTIKQMTGEGLIILAWQRPHNLVNIIKTAMEE